MPYMLSPMIAAGDPGMWSEGPAYEKESIYSISPGKMPPVNYDKHIIKSHSLTHLETPAHTNRDGKRLDVYYNESLSYFYGEAVVLKLKGDNYKHMGGDIYHWSIQTEEINSAFQRLKINQLPKRILITTEKYPLNKEGYHDPNYVLTLSQSAADYLVSNSSLLMYGTSWKSSDFNPGKAERPIHNTIFASALILENLNLKDVPEGIYFMVAFPLPLKDASESPVVPVLFEKDEIRNFI
jgi:arylformamidase